MEENDSCIISSILFGHNCLYSPTVNSGFPEIRRLRATAAYNPIIDAMWLPEPAIKEDGELCFDDVVANFFLEVGHRTLTGTTILCQMRFFAALIYEWINGVSLLEDSDVNHALLQRFEESVRSDSLVLDECCRQSMAIQEGYALFLAIEMSKLWFDTSPSDWFSPENLKFRHRRKWGRDGEYVIKQLERLTERSHKPILGLLVARNALNIPQILVWQGKSSVNEFRSNSDTVRQVLAFFSLPEHRPIDRFKQSMEILNRMPLEELSSVPDEGLTDKICRYDHRLNSLYEQPCREGRCICSLAGSCSTSDQVGDRDELNPLKAMLRLSQTVARETYPLFDDIAAIKSEVELFPDLAFKSFMYMRQLGHIMITGDRCSVRTKGFQGAQNLYLATLESIRQQIVDSSDSRSPRYSPQTCPWNSLKPFYNDHGNEWKEIRFRESLCMNFWQRTRDLRATKKWNPPHLGNHIGIRC